jgi:Domain of unknown function (DUF4912)
MAMTFLDAGHHSKIKLTPEEMFAISREISLKFSPNAASIGDDEGVAADARIFHADLQTNTGNADVDDHAAPTIASGFSSSDHKEDSITPENEKDVICAGERDAMIETDAPDTAAHRGMCFHRKELNDISREISRRFAPKAATAEPELCLLPVDPSHLYAYWDLGENKAQITPAYAAEKHLTLRIYWRPDASPETTSSNVWFDVAADNPESRQKVRLPIDDTAYSAALGKLNPDHSLDVLATSNIIQVPPTPGRMRTASLRRHQNTAPTGRGSSTASASLEQGGQASDALIDSEIKGSFYEKQKEGAYFPESSWVVKLHFGNPSVFGGDAAKIDSEVMAIFNAKGIGVELIPEPGLIEPSNVQGKNASGRGM